jgi:glycine cleavage system T protein (aminomethyltransferase)
MIKQSPYHRLFVELGATFVDKMGFAAPMFFSSPVEEHLATRERVGLFDVYYQVAIEVFGPDASAVLARVLVADTESQPVGRGVYSSICNEQGGMIDDLICFRLTEERFWICPTPSRSHHTVATLESAARGHRAAVINLGYKNAYMSVQGPASRDLLRSLTDADLSNEGLPYFGVTTGAVADVPGVVISRTGYSGELGYELFYPSEYAEHMLSTLLRRGEGYGAAPCGLGALASLRIEKRYPAYGADVNETTTPYEAGIGWTVQLRKANFNGRAALVKQKQEGISRCLVLLVLPPDAPVVTNGSVVSSQQLHIGSVTSAAMGHSVGHMLAMAYIRAEYAINGAEVVVNGPQGSSLSAIISTKPVYDCGNVRLRS